jgi:GNAT superfamily N-acetyltransferase
MSDDSILNPVVRRAVSSDAAQISACLLELGYGTSQELVSQKLALLAGSEHDVVFVADDPVGTGLLGVVSAHVFPLFHTPGQITRVTSLAVRSEARGKAIGRNLMEAVEKWSWAAGARRVEVTSGDHRPNAHAFYQAIGYSLDERRFIKHAPARAG